MYKVSVIVPVYNAEHYIERCCESLFSQRLDSIEYIFVNDGSTDNSIQLIKNVAQNYHNRLDSINIIDRKDNRGVAFSRQQGLENTNGEYVIHCDADDWVECDMYETLFNQAKQNDADIICCNYIIDSEGKNSRVVEFPKGDFQIQFNLSPIRGSLVNKLIRREMIVKNNIAFEKNINWGEDFLFSIKCQVLANRISVVHKAFYHYIQNKSSITHTISLPRYLELIDCGQVMESFLQSRGWSDRYDYQLKYLKFQLKQRFLRDPSLRDLKKWKNLYPECHGEIDLYPIARYLKFAAKLVNNGHDLLATSILKMYDFYNVLRK